MSREWSFQVDMNYDGLVTITDVWLWFKWLFYYPGDLVVAVLLGTPVGTFFEMSLDSYGGWLSLVVSLLVWLVVLFYAALAVDS